MVPYARFSSIQHFPPIVRARYDLLSLTSVKEVGQDDRTLPGFIVMRMDEEMLAQVL